MRPEQRNNGCKWLLAAAAFAGVCNMVWGTIADPAAENHRNLVAMFSRFDSVFKTLAPRAGKVLLEFDDFDNTKSGDRLLQRILYFRAVYSMYPSHVALGNPGAVLFQDDQILRATQVPIDSILRQEPIDMVLRFHRVGGQVLINPIYLDSQSAPSLPERSEAGQ